MADARGDTCFDCESEEYIGLLGSPSLLQFCQVIENNGDGFNEFMDETMDTTPYLSDIGTVKEEMDDYNLLEKTDVIDRRTSDNEEWAKIDEDLSSIEDENRPASCKIREADNYFYQGNSAERLLNSKEESLVLFRDPIISDAAIYASGKFVNKSNRRKMFKSEDETLCETTTRRREFTRTSKPEFRASTSKCIQRSLDSYYVPQVRPRKYSISSPDVRNDPSYRLKREKNNDAVRKSRMKTKQLQRRREDELRSMLFQLNSYKDELSKKENKITSLRTELRNKDAVIRRLESKIDQMNASSNTSSRLK